MSCSEGMRESGRFDGNGKFDEILPTLFATPNVQMRWLKGPNESDMDFGNMVNLAKWQI